MRCEEAASLMPAYLEGELPEAKRLELEKHLSSCPTCKRKFEELVRNRELLNRERDNILKAPRMLAEGVLERIRREKETLRKRARMLRSGLLGFVFALGAAFLTTLFKRKKHQPERR